MRKKRTITTPYFVPIAYRDSTPNTQMAAALIVHSPRAELQLEKSKNFRIEPKYSVRKEGALHRNIVIYLIIFLMPSIIVKSEGLLLSFFHAIDNCNRWGIFFSSINFTLALN